MDALHATLEGSDIPPEARLPDFVSLIADQMTELGDNWDVLYLEFVLYAMRNPTARAKLAEHRAVSIEQLAALISAEQARQGIALEHAEHMAMIVVALFHGIGLMRALQVEVDESFLETAMTFVARGLLPATTPSTT
jgi:AcrR family transcriptional regulator